MSEEGGYFFVGPESEQMREAFFQKVQEDFRKLSKEMRESGWDGTLSVTLSPLAIARLSEIGDSDDTHLTWSLTNEQFDAEFRRKLPVDLPELGLP